MNAITVNLTLAEFDEWNYASLAAGLRVREWGLTMLDLATCDPPGVIAMSEINPAWGTVDAASRFTIYGDSVNFQWWRETLSITRFPSEFLISSPKAAGEAYLLECWAKVTLNRASKLALPNR